MMADIPQLGRIYWMIKTYQVPETKLAGLLTWQPLGWPKRRLFSIPQTDQKNDDLICIVESYRKMIQHFSIHEHLMKLFKTFQNHAVINSSSPCFFNFFFNVTFFSYTNTSQSGPSSDFRPCRFRHRLCDLLTELSELPNTTQRYAPVLLAARQFGWLDFFNGDGRSRHLDR